VETDKNRDKCSFDVTCVDHFHVTCVDIRCFQFFLINLIRIPNRFQFQTESSKSAKRSLFFVLSHLICFAEKKLEKNSDISDRGHKFKIVSIFDCRRKKNK